MFFKRTEGAKHGLIHEYDDEYDDGDQLEATCKEAFMT
jgi:hypothetical protein